MEPRDRTTGPHDPVDPGQAGPRPSDEISAEVDKTDAIRRKMREHPHANADEIIEMLAAEGIQVSATTVFQQMKAGGVIG